MKILLSSISLLLLGLSLPAKEWKTVNNTSIFGDYVHSSDTELVIRTIDGEKVTIDRSSLVDSDRKFLTTLEQLRSDIGIPSWPNRLRPGSDIRLRGGPNMYHSTHFRIHNSGVTAERLYQLATIMEDTLAAIASMPTGLELKPPAPSTYFHARLMDRRSFDREFEKVGMHLILPNQKVRGAYIAQKRELWLPIDSDQKLQNPAMIHEVCHQTMHDWLPLLPVWFIEGFSEYMASIPYENRSFRFDKSKQGLRQAIQARYNVSPERVQILHPGKLMDLNNQWRNTTLEYLSSIFLVYYIIHLDGSGNGEAFNRFVSQIAHSRDRANEMLADIQNIADTYNSKVANYRRQVIEYRRKLSEANSQMRSGKKVFIRSKAPGKMVIAGTPAVPDAPQTPGAPPMEALSSQRKRTLELINLLNQRSVIALLSNRSFDDFAKQMQGAFRQQGINISFL